MPSAHEFGKGYRLLIVDDEELIRDVLATLIAPFGFAIEQAEDVASARRAFTDHAPDVVITDKNLPDGSGVDWARELKASGADCEIIVITGYGSYESTLEALKLGVSDYLAKPFDDIDDVITSLRRALRKLTDARTAREAERAASLVPAKESHRRVRFFVELRVRFVLVDGSLTGAAFVPQLSTHDLFVETDQPLEIGSRVRMLLYVPGRGTPVEASGVVRRHGETATLRGMRIDLVDLSREASAAIGEYLAPLRKPFEPEANPPEPGGVLAPVVAPDPSMWDDPPPGPEGFVETVDPEVPVLHRAIHDEKEADVVDLLAASGAMGEFEGAPAERFDPENVAPENLSRLARSLEEGVRVDPPRASTPESPAPPIPATPAARKGFARELLQQGKDAFARGLVLKAAADVALALAFDPDDDEIRLLNERVRSAADVARAEDLYRQGVQQAALGDPAAAAELLVTAHQLSHGERRFLVAAVRALLQTGTLRAARRAGSLLRAAIATRPDDADLFVLYGSAAEAEGADDVARRAYRRAMEIEPHHSAARALLGRRR